MDIFTKAIDVVTIQAGYYGIPKDIALKNAEKYLKILGLWEKRDARVIELS
jgi:ABC-2 type transport system ATP-binding protein